MNITVVGAAGRTGHRIVEQAVRASYRVTAVVRDPVAYEPPSADVSVHRADVLEPSSLRGVLADTDAVIVAVGPKNGKQPAGVYSEGLANLTDEMLRAGVRRLVTLSAAPASLPREKSPFERYVLHPILWRFFGPSYADLRLMERALRDGHSIDWTIVRPPLLTDDDPVGAYRTAIDSRLHGAKLISRADLASLLLAAATDDALIGHVVTVSV